MRPETLRSLNLKSVLPTDDRRMECVADDLPLPHGGKVAVNCTLVSPLRRNGAARPRAHKEEGAALADSFKRKQTRYPELCRQGTRCQLVFAGMEVGGRWGQDACDFVSFLAFARARDAPPLLKGSAYRARQRRWIAMLSVAGMRAFAGILLHGDARSTEASDGREPTLGQLLGDEPHQEGPQ